MIEKFLGFLYRHPVKKRGVGSNEILKKYLSVEDCMKAAEECGAPIVSIAGGEPLIHPDIVDIVKGLVDQGRYVYLCTNALLLERYIDQMPK